MAKERIYRRTAAGQAALAEGNIGLAGGEYRRILHLLADDTHYDGLRAALAHYSDAIVTRWLRELESRGLLESSAGESSQDLDFTGSFRREDLFPNDKG